MSATTDYVINSTEKIQEAFRVIQSVNYSSPGMLEPYLFDLESGLQDIFKKDTDMVYHVHIIYPKPKETFFVMSVFPEQSTMDRLINASITNENTSYIKELWRKNTEWNIEIDSRIFNKSIINLTPGELTAILLHEVGHTIYSNTVLFRLSNILKFEYQKLSMANKQMIGNSMFRKVFRIPVIRGCMFDSKKENLKNEIKADKFATELGYRSELVSALTKLLKIGQISAQKSVKDDIEMYYRFSNDIMSQLANRRGVLAKKNIDMIEESTSSISMLEAVDDIKNTLFIGGIKFGGFMSNEMKLEYVYKEAENLTNMDTLLHVTESAILGKKKLDPIPSDELDYLEVKIEDIKSTDDKLMLLGYIHNKIDTINYYLSILDNKTYRNKYIVPHSKEELLFMLKRLNAIRLRVMDYRIPRKPSLINIEYPDGYEG